uniref:t-SNARE coiled-coil homology domain-containing protein n=1 Tax=Panagrellus redivivus TaxID=6233 RepID=A0A7E4VLQ1_PANRE
MKIRSQYDSPGSLPSESTRPATNVEQQRTPVNSKRFERTKPETPVNRIIRNEQSMMNLSAEKKNKTKPTIIDNKTRKIVKLAEGIEAVDIEIEVQQAFNDDLRAELEDYRDLVDRTKNVLDRTIRTKVSKVTIDVDSPCIEITSLQQSEALFSKFAKKSAPNHVYDENLILIEQKHNRLRSIFDDMQSQCQNLVSQAQNVLEELDARIALREVN